MPRAIPGPDLSFEITHTHLSHFLRISGQRLNELTDKGIVRRGTDQNGQTVVGRYRFDVAVSDYMEHQRRQARGLSDSLEAAKARMAAVKGAIAEMRLGSLQGAFVDAEDAGEVFRAVVMRMKSKLLSVLPRLIRAAYHSSSIEEAQTKGQSYFGEVMDELSRLGTKDLTRPKLKVVRGAHTEKDAAKNED